MVIGLNVSNSSATSNTRQFAVNTSQSRGLPLRDAGEAEGDASGDALEAGDLMAIGWMVSGCSVRVQWKPCPLLRTSCSGLWSLRFARPI